MKIAKRSADSDEFKSGASGGVTAENYPARCAAFIRGRGGKGFVIRAIQGEDGSLASKHAATEPQWIAWMRYFSDKEIPHAYALSRGMTTVPCEWPEDFDYEAYPSDRDATLPQPKPRANAYQRAETARRMFALAASLATRDHRQKRTDVGAMSRVEAERHLVEIEARFASEPIPKLGSYAIPSPNTETGGVA